jgi:7,8-dihydroneopterin aldolase/epimerase/oxygenase
MQYIYIRDLHIDTLIGVYAEERTHKQRLILDIEVGIPHKHAFVSDRLGDTIDYVDVVALIKREAQAQQFLLLERLAQHLVELIEKEFEASWVKLRINKGGVVPGAGEVGVVLEHGAKEAPTVKALFGGSVMQP